MPVEKVDKPEPPPAYYVDATVETKDDRGKRQQQEQSSDEYSGSHAAPGWQKIYSSATNRHYLKLRRDDIARAWFRNTLMQRGITLAEVDIETRGGKLLRGAHVILPAREDYWRLKQFQMGQEIPLNMFIKEPVIEISIPNLVQTSQTSTTEATRETKTIGMKIDIKKVIITAVIGLAILLLIILAASK